MASRCPPPLLLIMQDLTIMGRIRIQQYGFCIHQQYAEAEGLGFYADWKRYHFGPYSPALADDLDAAIRAGHVLETGGPGGGPGPNRYELAAGASKEYASLKENLDYVAGIRRMLAKLETLSLTGLLKQIYWDYPEYAVRGQIRGQTSGQVSG